MLPCAPLEHEEDENVTGSKVGRTRERRESVNDSRFAQGARMDKVNLNQVFEQFSEPSNIHRSRYYMLK